MTYLFLDTNSYIQYQDFEFIKWEEICNDKDFIIAVTCIAIREIDKHKDSSRGKLQNRAKRCSKKINQILRGKVSSKVALRIILKLSAVLRKWGREDGGVEKFC